MKVIQIKGANGSGKTTIAKQLIALSQEVRLRSDTHGKIYATILADLKWIVIGKYDPESKMGGCDGLPTVAYTKESIEKCIKCHPDYHGIVFEGMMISTIKSTFYDYLLHLEKSYGIEPLFVILDTTGFNCVERIMGRGTMKPGLKEQNVYDKVETIKRHALTYDQKYVRWMKVDKIHQESMLTEFCELIDCKFS